jgi:hypothetical protein
MEGLVRGATNYFGITTNKDLPAFYVSKPWANYDEATKQYCKPLFDFVLQHNVENGVYVYRDAHKAFLTKNYTKNSLLNSAAVVFKRQNPGNGFDVYNWDTASLSKFVFAIIYAAASFNLTKTKNNSMAKMSLSDLEKKIRNAMPREDQSKVLKSKPWMNPENESKIAVISVNDCFHFMIFTYNAATVQQYYVYSLKLYVENGNDIRTLDIEEVTDTNTKPLTVWMKLFHQTTQKANGAALAHAQPGGDHTGSSQPGSRAPSVGSSHGRTRNPPANADAAQHQSHQHGHQHANDAGAGAGTSVVPGPAARNHSKSRGNTPESRPNAIPASHVKPHIVHNHAKDHVVIPANGADEPARSASRGPANKKRAASNERKPDASEERKRAASAERRAASAERRAAPVGRKRAASAEGKRRGGTSKLYKWTGVDRDTYELWTAMALTVLTKREDSDKKRLIAKLLPIVAREMFGLDCESVHSVETHVYDGKGHHASANTQDGQIFIMYRNGNNVEFYYQGSEIIDLFKARECTLNIEDTKNDYFSTVVAMPSKHSDEDRQLFIEQPDGSFYV